MLARLVACFALATLLAGCPSWAPFLAGPDTDAGGADAGGADAGGADAGGADAGGGAAVYIKASNTNPGDSFGNALALSSDGATLAVGAQYEASNATGIGGNQRDDSASNAGAVYVFARAGGTWLPQAYVKASNTDANDTFGYAVALSSDGSTLAVGAVYESSNATGLHGDQSDNSATQAGAVYVFRRVGTAWSQEAYVKASNTDMNDLFGVSVALSADGSTLAVGASGESSGATGVGGTETDNTAAAAGAVYVFRRAGAAWSQEAYVKASNTDAVDYFGDPVALSADGATLVVGAAHEASSATGIGGNQIDNGATDAGAVYVFTREGIAWSQQAYVKASNTGTGDLFGHAVSLAADGSTLAVGAAQEASNAIGVGGSQTDNTVGGAGAAYVFTRAGTTWSQQAYVKASNTDAGDQFGCSVALSSDGAERAFGALSEASNAVDVGGNQADNSYVSAGAVYLYYH